MPNALKTLFGTVQASSFMSGVSFVLGMEEINTQRYSLPLVVMVPIGGPYVPPQNVGVPPNGLDPETSMFWEIPETVDFWLWNASTDPSAQSAIDHTDAIESLRQLLLSALQDQQVQYTNTNSIAYGLSWRATSERWETAANAVSRFGRALVVSVEMNISITTAPPPRITVNQTTINPTI